MDCTEFSTRLDAYIDGELSNAQREALLAHAQSCSACREELRRAQVIARALGEANTDLRVPLEAQAAWRSAVRREAKRRKGRVLSRTISAVAAAFVLLAGTTAVFRATGVLDFGGEASLVSGVHIVPSAPRVQYYETQSRASQDEEQAYTHAQIEADGADTAPEKATAEADNTPLSARMAVQSDAAADEETVPAYDQGSAGEAESLLSATPAPQRELIARSATREFYTESFDQVRQAIDDLVEEYNGRVVSDELAGQQGARSATLAIDVPAQELDAFLEALDFVAEASYKSVNSEDISANYYDAQGRLESLRLEQERLNELLSQAEDAQASRELNQRLEEVYAQIDELEGRLRTFDNQLATARVDVVLNEGAQLEATAITGGSTGGSAREGLSRSLDALGAFFSDMGVSLAIIAPYAGLAVALIALVWVVVVLLARHRRE